MLFVNMLKFPCVLDPDVAICVRGASDFQNCEKVPSETARSIADAIIASELSSLGEARVPMYVCLYRILNIILVLVLRFLILIVSISPSSS